MGWESNWLVFCVAAMALDELSGTELSAPMLVGFLLSDKVVICSDDAPAGSLLVVELVATAPSESALEDALSLSVECAASTLSCSR